MFNPQLRTQKRIVGMVFIQGGHGPGKPGNGGKIVAFEIPVGNSASILRCGATSSNTIKRKSSSFKNHIHERNFGRVLDLYNESLKEQIVATPQQMWFVWAEILVVPKNIHADWVKEIAIMTPIAKKD